MIIRTVAAAVLAVITTVSAAEFPLTYRAIPADRVFSFPGGYGVYTQLRLKRPTQVTEEPKPVSRRPVYGEVELGGKTLALRLDETKGTSKGYDQLIVDFNGNGNLKDDASVSPVSSAGTPRTPLRITDAVFGPMQPPGAKPIAGGLPVSVARVYIPILPEVEGARLDNIYAGQIIFKSAWYAEALVEVENLKIKMGLFDGDGNRRLGDVSKPVTYNSGAGAEKSWYFPDADTLLIDADNSGTFENDPLQNEHRMFAPFVSIEGTAYRIAVSEDQKSLRVEPWNDELVDVTIDSGQAVVHSISLGWEAEKDQWQLIRARNIDGKIRVPPGNFRVYASTVLGKVSAEEQVLIRGFQRVATKPVVFSAGHANKLACGGPLQVRVEAEKRKPHPWEVTQNPAKSSDSEYVLAINATVNGAAGEIYSSFLKGAKLDSEPEKPSFTISTTDGKELAKGNLEYG